MKKFFNKKIITMALALVLTLAFCTTFVIAATPGHSHKWMVLDYNDIIVNLYCDCGAQINVPVSHLECVHDLVIESSDEEYHDYWCQNNCGYYYRMDHDFVVIPADDESKHTKICVDCDYTIVEDHTFESSYTENGHKLICTLCSYETSEESHNFVDNFCTVCGYTKECDHNFNTVCFYNENVHMTACENCFEVLETEAHEYSYTVAGYGAHQKVCSVCGYTAVWEPDTACTCGYITEDTTTTIYGIYMGCYYSDKGYYSLILVDGENIACIFPNKPTFTVGSFVGATIDENDVVVDWNIIVEYDVVNDIQKLPIYVDKFVLEQMDYIDYDSNTVDEVEISKYDLTITFEDGTFLVIPNDYIVYDFKYIEEVDADFICEGESLIWFEVNNTMYILDLLKME